MHKRTLGTVLASVLMASTAASAAELPKDTTDYIDYAVGNGQYVGMVVGYIDDDQTVIKGFGLTAKENGTTPDGNTVYQIGSITKTFTATLLAEEIDAGRMKLSDPVQKYLPDGVTLAQVGDRPITIEDVATHRSGLPRMPADFKIADPDDPYQGVGIDTLWGYVKTVKPARAPGVAPEYSNFGFSILGQLVARETGKPYGDLLKARIFKPLGMTSTDVTLTDALKTHAAQGYGAGGKPVPFWELSGFAPAGAIDSTAKDMLAYIRANMAASKDGKTDLSKAMALAHEPRADFGGPIRIGLAWLTTPTGDGHWHNGGTGGFRSFAGFTSDGKRGVVILTNSGILGVDEIGYHLLNASSPLPETYKEIAVAPEKLDEYVGKYQLTPQAMFTVTHDGGTLDVQLTGQPATAIYAYKPDNFFAKAVEAQFTFARSADGKITGLVLHQASQNLHAARLGADDKPIETVKTLDLTPEQLDAYVGNYQLTPQLVFTIAREGTQLMAQLTGQPSLPVFADKPDHFFYKVVEAQLDFERDGAGKVISVTLHQNGHDLKAPRIAEDEKKN